MFDLEQLIKMQDPNFRGTIEEKAHDNINDLIDDFEHKDLLQGLVMGMGGGGANIGKVGKNILSKIKARNARGLRNLEEGQGTGAQSVSPSNREFINKEWADWRKLIDKRGPSSSNDSETYMNMLKTGGGLGLAGLIKWLKNKE